MSNQPKRMERKRNQLESTRILVGFFSYLFSDEHVCCLNITTRIWVAGTTKWQTRSPPKQHGPCSMGNYVANETIGIHSSITASSVSGQFRACESTLLLSHIG